jgi:hypothetical protein
VKTVYKLAAGKPEQKKPFQKSTIRWESGGIITKNKIQRNRL